jgi:hypothetical protein
MHIEYLMRWIVVNQLRLLNFLNNSHPDLTILGWVLDRILNQVCNDLLQADGVNQ